MILLLALALVGFACLAGLAELATAEPTTASATTRWMRSIKQGIRGSTFQMLAIAPSDSDSMYLSSAEGFVYASHDGGVTWTEARLHVERSVFLGSKRSADSMVSFGAFGGAWAAMAAQGFLSANPADLYRFQYGTTGEPYLEFTPDSPAFWPSIAPTGLPSVGKASVEDGYSEGRSSAGFRLAKGRSAWRLVFLLAKKNLPIPSMNLYKTLATKASSPTTVGQIAIDPANANRAFAGTAAGLFGTNDGGDSWQQLYPGTNARDRIVHFMEFSPATPGQLWAGTGQGVLISDDGVQFQSMAGAPFASYAVHDVEWAQGHTNHVYVATDSGGFCTHDGGVNWTWCFYQTLPRANTVRSMAADSANPMRVLAATDDGMFGSIDGGETWDRVGGLVLTGAWLSRVVSDPQRSGHFITITYTDVWETFDGGDTWSIVYINNSDWWLRWVDFDYRRPESLWLLTSNEIIELSTRPPEQPDAAGLAKYRAFAKAEPTLGQVILAAFDEFDIATDSRVSRRALIRHRNWLPRVTVAGGYLETDHFAFLGAVFLQSPSQSPNAGQKSPYPDQDLAEFYGDRANATFDRSERKGMPYLGVFLSWDLQSAAFVREEMQWDRMASDARDSRNRLKVELQRLWEERNRKLLEYFAKPPADLPTRIALRLRLEELTIHMDRLTGGLYAASLDWLQQQPLPWNVSAAAAR